MKLYAPKYYKKFHCIANRCEHSCCVGWEIDIDETTLKKYKTLNCAYASVILDSITTEDTPHFRLTEGDRCPHLDEQGLCKIILHTGEDYLCDICREHPRFYNYTDACEVGIGLSCPEAARLVLSSSEEERTMEEIGEINATADSIAFDGRAERGKLYAILQSTHPYSEGLEAIYREYALSAGEDDHWLALLDSLEYLDAKHKALFMKYSSSCRPEGADEYLKRFLEYLLYRHCTEAFDAEDFCARLTFCLFCERLLASLICVEKATSLQEIATLASIISEELEYSEENTLALMS